jgi:hypothetical protein
MPPVCAGAVRDAVLTRLGRGCDNARMRGTGRSILSIGSAGSMLSVGSLGSILSLGSAGSILSAFSRRSLLAWRGDRQRPTRRLDAAAPPEIAAPEPNRSPGCPPAGAS